MWLYIKVKISQLINKNDNVPRVSSEMGGGTLKCKHNMTALGIEEQGKKLAYYKVNFCSLVSG